jgi:enoyl-CoA hydratase/carnithine racemase
MISGFFDQPDPGACLVRFAGSLQDAFSRLEQLPVPTVAVINGPAVGGGLELALSCDIRVATPEAQLGLPEVGVGLLPGAGGTQRLPALIGPGAARRLILTGELICGTEAARIGLVELLATPPEIVKASRRLAEQLAGVSPAAVRAAKTCMSLAGSSRGGPAELAASRTLGAMAETRHLIEHFLSSSRKEAI